MSERKINGIYTVVKELAVREIPLSQGRVALVDAIDYERVSAFKWTLTKPRKGKLEYAVRYPPTSQSAKKRTTPLRMHRFILHASPHEEIDHRDGNGLNNTRANLRFATRRENSRNIGIRANNTSGFKGVTKYAGRWKVQIQFEGRGLNMWPLYDSPEEAANAYDYLAKKLFGEFAWLNFPEKRETKMTPLLCGCSETKSCADHGRGERSARESFTVAQVRAAIFDTFDSSHPNAPRFFFEGQSIKCANGGYETVSEKVATEERYRFADAIIARARQLQEQKR